MVARIYSGFERTRSLKTAEGGYPRLSDGCLCLICCAEEDWSLADEIGRPGADGEGHGHSRRTPGTPPQGLVSVVGLLVHQKVHLDVAQLPGGLPLATLAGECLSKYRDDPVGQV